MVGALDVDCALEAALPFGEVVGHIGHEISVRAITLSHHAIFVVAVIRAFQPKRAVFFIRFASSDELLNRGFHATAGVERRLKVIVIKLNVERLQIQILLAA